MHLNNEHLQKLKKAAQYFVLTTALFMQNDLLTYAASTAYGFLCSLLPVITLVASILLRFFRTSPQVLMDFIPPNGALAQAIDLPRVIDSVLLTKKFGILEVIVGISLFWMARRFFLYVMRGFSTIFHAHGSRKPFIYSLFSVVSEVALVVFIAFFIFLSIAFKSILRITGLLGFIPLLFRQNGFLLINASFGALTFLFLLLAYRFASGTKPPLKLCAVSSLGCTAVFFVSDSVFRLFIGISRYNLVYGVLTNLIVILLEVFLFFILFLYFAQFICVCQFFDLLMLEQLYLLPHGKNFSPKGMVFHHVFAAEESLSNAHTATFTKGKALYKTGERAHTVFFVKSGTVSVFANNHLEYKGEGAFLAESETVLSGYHEATARAETDVCALCIERTEFARLLSFSPEANKKLLQSVTKDFFCE